MIDNRIKWTKSDGTILPHGAAAVAGTYYGELPYCDLLGFWAGIVWDVTDVSAYTLESAGTPSGELTGYAATGTGWTSQATVLGTKTSASAASCDEWQVSTTTAYRWRVKRVCTTPGVATLRHNAKVS